jgi:hypothetical protein
VAPPPPDHPGRKLVADGAIGRLAYVRAALSVSVEPGDIRRSVELGGGALNDLGCYCVSGIRLFAGEPSRVYADQVRDGPAGVDLRLAATLRMPGDVLAQLDVGLDLTRREPIPVDPDGAFALTDPDHDVYRVELDTVSAALAAGAEPPSAAPTRSPRPLPSRPSTARLSSPPRSVSPTAGLVGGSGHGSAPVRVPGTVKASRKRARACSLSPEAHASSPTVPR